MRSGLILYCRESEAAVQDCSLRRSRSKPDNVKVFLSQIEQSSHEPGRYAKPSR
jgi:hypothetical protein